MNYPQDIESEFVDEMINYMYFKSQTEDIQSNRTMFRHNHINIYWKVWCN